MRGGGGGAHGPPAEASAVHDRAATALFGALLLCSAAYEGRGAARSAGGEDAAALALQVALANRWNVFGPAEPFVTWEIAPGKLGDGSVREVWRGSDAVSWAPPEPGGGGGALWHGRYRMFPLLGAAAQDEGEAGARFWEAVCREWDRRQGDAARKLTRFKFFTLRAPLLPGGGYGPVSKSLVREHTCSEPAD